MKPEVESPLNRICISYNRRGRRAFAVFLLSFFIRMCRRGVSAVGCRSPPIQSGFFTFSKIRIGGNKEWHITTDVRIGNGVSGKKPTTVADLLDEIEDEKLYQALLTVDKHTLLILLLKMQGYSTREIAAMAGLTERAVYKRLERLRKKLKPIFYPFGEI